MTWALLSSYHSSIVKVLGSSFQEPGDSTCLLSFCQGAISHLFLGIKPPTCCLKLRQYIGFGLSAVRFPCDCDGKALASTGSRFAVVIGLPSGETACSTAGALFYISPFSLSRANLRSISISFFLPPLTPVRFDSGPSDLYRSGKGLLASSFIINLPFGEIGSVSTQRARFYHAGDMSQGIQVTNFQIGGTSF
jgi:hypothetical protein